MVYIIATLLRKAFEARRAGWDGQGGWQRLMLVPADYAENESALFHPLTRALMDRIDFRHGGPEFDRKYPDGIPTTVDIDHAKLGTLTSGLVMYPEGHARSTTGNLPALLDHKFRLLAGLGVDDVDRSRGSDSRIWPRSRRKKSANLYDFQNSRAIELVRRSAATSRSRPSTNRGGRGELGMFIALRYLVTVRRATVMPALPSSSTIASSESGLRLVFVVDDFLQLDAARGPRRLPRRRPPVVPPTKNRLSGKMPRGV